MADYVSREVARERLRKACKAGSIVAAFFLLAGLLYGGIAAVVATNAAVPELLLSALYMVVPTMGDPTLALAECATKAVLLVLVGLMGILMFRKVSKTGDAFRAGQMRQLKFIALLVVLLGFLPTLVGNVAKIVMSLQKGGSPMAVMSFAVEPLCVAAGLLMFMVARVLVAGAVLGAQEGQMASEMPASFEPNYAGMPDLSQVTTATPLSQVAPATTVIPVDETLAGEGFGVHDGE